MELRHVRQSVRGIPERAVGRTCVMIVHRVLMARDADHVAVVHDGQVAEEGTHQDLLEQPEGLYRTLFAQQYGEQRLPPARGGEA